MEHRTLTTADGHRLAADIARTESARGAVVVCHPHPRFGGNRHHPVVDAVFRALPPAGFDAIRFDFRAEHADGIGEQLDVVAALDALDASGVAIGTHVVGYSFGAVVGLTTDDIRITSIVAIAPPLPLMPTPAPGVPTLVLAPEHDQFCPPEIAEALVAGWPEVEVRPVPMADHFLAGRAAHVADSVVDWLSGRVHR